ncbi:SigE family RNA polymerase sigma factor [Phytohabitans flavus]|uniref:RNA polymerase sigma24 factor n=1 Tax=Phytohabitans flavus TaxID=1076124 RepID=A0A6F8Y6B5_9ACTN|nr:sigma-70 family RNA polymerase sigma factor [Phytohabitans flavus]BCB81635.1 RNA polymerase sigma24 factor [Phytohabitans flavus]
MDADEAVREVYEASYRRLVGQLFGVTGDLAEAEDAVQEAFARAVARPRVFLELADHEAWLRTVAINVARNRYRRRWVFDRLLRTGRVWTPPETVPELAADGLDLIAALRTLPYRVRTALVLYHVVDLPVDEVAATLGASPNTVKSWLARGRAALARELGEPRVEPAKESAHD